MRRNLSHAFSDKALRQQEPIVQSYTNLLVHRLGEHAEKGDAVDMTRWYNYTTFDVITDLSFGEPLYCLRDDHFHQWINLVFASVKAMSIMAMNTRYPMFHYYDKVKTYFTQSADAKKTRVDFFNKSRAQVEARLEKGTETRPDFFSFILKNQDQGSKALTRGEIDSNAVLFLVAGSETTATALSGTTYLLLKNPEAYAKVVKEIRSHFTSQAEITIDEVSKLEYLSACLQEGLRRYPPVPTGFPRVVPAGGDTISGHYIPEGTSVYVSQHATNHSTRNYKDPELFVPERWLGDERYKNDKRESFSPFSFGPRNCIGKK